MTRFCKSKAANAWLESLSVDDRIDLENEWGVVEVAFNAGMRHAAGLKVECNLVAYREGGDPQAFNEGFLAGVCKKNKAIQDEE